MATIQNSPPPGTSQTSTGGGGSTTSKPLLQNRWLRIAIIVVLVYFIVVPKGRREAKGMVNGVATMLEMPPPFDVPAEPRSTDVAVAAQANQGPPPVPHVTTKGASTRRNLQAVVRPKDGMKFYVLLDPGATANLGCEQYYTGPAIVEPSTSPTTGPVLLVETLADDGSDVNSRFAAPAGYEWVEFPPAPGATRGFWVARPIGGRAGLAAGTPRHAMPAPRL